jgi:DNA-binding MarR family transcriptional regulator
MEDYAMNESIEFLLRAVNRRAEKLANQELAKFDLTSTQFRTLTYLSHQPPLTVRQCDLEVFFSKSNPAVTGILNNMEQKDLIRRVCNPADGRSKVLEITEKGLALLPQLDAYRGWMDKLLTENMTEEEKAILIVLLKKMRNSANLRDK